MDTIMNVSPGLIFWTIFNFLIFLFLLLKFGTKPMANALKKRENLIKESLENAEKANIEAKRILKESQEKLNSTQIEINEMINRGKLLSDDLLRKASEEAEAIKKEKVEEAKREIERSKEIALKQLRSEVAELVVIATDKIIGEKLSSEKDYKLVESYIEQIPKN
jgi:F-type H+-transporting ATPase subunit b